VLGKKIILVVVGLAAVAAIAATGLLWFSRGDQPASAAEPVSRLGFTYLPVSQGSACCYGLPVDSSGAVVTSVVSGGAFDLAGVQCGAVVTSCNGVKVDEGSSLLGLIKNNPAGQDLSLVIYDGSGDKTYTFMTDASR
jgi:S1-C subfamily serine protease